MITRNDLSKTSGSSPTGATKTSKPAKQSEHPERNQQWFVVDKEGLRKTLSRKGKAFAIYELLQNAYDEASTKVEVTLREPKDGKSVLTCTDDSPKGYSDLSQAHTMFAESKKKSDEKKRGRFNVGEKHVLALCDSASITSTSGRTVFMANGNRKHDSVKTQAGTQFQGILPLTQKEYAEVVEQVRLVIPPIPTTFNGQPLLIRKHLHEFTAKLPTEIADDNGVLRSRVRQTRVRLYKSNQPMLYEMGMPVVEIHCKWSVDIQQKVPLNIERDNVTPSYLKHIYLMVVNEMHEHFTEEDAAASWIPLDDPRLKLEAIKKIVETRYGKKAVIEDPTDVGSRVEAAVHGTNVVPRGTLTRAEIKNVRDKLPGTDLLKKAGEVHPTNFSDTSKTIVPPEKYTKNLKHFVKFIEDASPKMIPHAVTVKVIDDPAVKVLGCTHWEPETYVFKINLAYQNVDDWLANVSLFIHEVAHHAAQNNNHGGRDFWEATTALGAKLAQLALEEPNLFPEMEALEEVAA